MIQIKQINLFDENGNFLGCIDGLSFKKIGNQFFEIINSNENNNFKYLKMASLFRNIDEDIASFCFNKVDKNKLNILEQLMYELTYMNLTNK